MENIIHIPEGMDLNALEEQPGPANATNTGSKDNVREILNQLLKELKSGNTKTAREKHIEQTAILRRSQVGKNGGFKTTSEAADSAIKSLCELDLITGEDVAQMVWQIMNLPPDELKHKAALQFTDESGQPIKQKHALVLIVDEVLRAAKKRDWGLAKHLDFVYVFTGRHWQQLDKDELKYFLSQAAQALGYSSMESRYYEFQDKLLKQFLAEANLPAPEVDPDTILINLQNGTLEITPNGPKLRAHRPEDFLTYLLPFEFSQHAQAPLFQRYLQQVLPQQSTQDVLAEYVAYCFLPSLKLEKALVLYGSGANGKSVFHDVVTSMLGKNNVSSCSLANLAEEHNRAMLSDKLLNYGSEINAGAISRDLFKQLASGEPVQARMKYGHPFEMHRYARMMFNANTLPSDVEQTEAFFRRFLVIPFAVTVPEAEQDKTLAAKIISKELPGVFAWVLRGLDRLNKQKKFSHCPEAEASLKKYRRESDSVALFIEEGENGSYIPSTEAYLKQDTMYSEYRSFCSDSGFKAVSARKFKERLEKLGFQTHKRNFGKIVYARFVPYGSEQ
jgi:putative DNA primase/helicase